MRALRRRLVAVVAALLLTVLATVVTGLRGGVSGRMGVRRGTCALVMGLRTMWSIAWFPLALLLFQLTESVILARDAVRTRPIGRPLPGVSRLVWRLFGLAQVAAGELRAQQGGGGQQKEQA